MHQLDVFLKLRHDPLSGIVTVIDDEPGVEYDYRTEEDAKKERSRIRHANIIKPNIVFCNILGEPDEIYNYIKSMTKDKLEYAKFEVDAELTNKKEYLDAVELINIIALFCITSDPACLNDDVRYYVRENPCYGEGELSYVN